MRTVVGSAKRTVVGIGVFVAANVVLAVFLGSIGFRGPAAVVIGLAGSVSAALLVLGQMDRTRRPGESDD